MTAIAVITAFVPLTWDQVPLRLGAAFLTGAIIGLERENHGRAAGLRTTVLVCVAAAIAMILSGYLFVDGQDASSTWHPDPARLAAGILTGMGFLGAGAIIREGRVVRGVTTAAVLWFTTVLGLAFGAGHFSLGLSGLGIAVLTLFILPRLEGLIRSDWYGSVIITLGLTGMTDAQLKARLEQLGVIVKSVELDYDLTRQRRIVHCRVKYKRGLVCEVSQQVVHDLVGCEGVTQVRWT
jgi:putative Mg2+ transporter-C (MgtC) family protein